MADNTETRKHPRHDLLVRSDGYVYVPYRDEWTAGHAGPYGYMRVFARRGTFLVHTLVAETFLGPKPEGMVVSHVDGDRSNNSVANIRYVPYRRDSVDPGAARERGSYRCSGGRPGSYYARNSVRCREYSRKYHMEHREEHLAALREYNRTHAEEHRESARKYRETHRMLRVSTGRCRWVPEAVAEAYRAYRWQDRTPELLESLLSGIPV